MDKNSLELLYWVEQDLRDISKLIIPKKEYKFLPPMIKDINSISPLMDYIYVIEKFLGSRIIPYKYRIIYSDQFNVTKLDKKSLERLRLLKSLLTRGNKRINDRSYNFLPRSTKSYFRSEYANSKEYRFSPDYNSEFFGIKHFHLNGPSDDDLIFFSTKEDMIFLLKIGTHKNLYDKGNVECIVRNYPELVEHNQILKLDGILPGEDLSVEKVKALWTAGINVSFLIDGAAYTGMPQTFARINSRITTILQNITYQIERFMTNFISELVLDNSVDINGLKFSIKRSNPSIKNGQIEVFEETTSKTGNLYIPYLDLIAVLEYMCIEQNNDA